MNTQKTTEFGQLRKEIDGLIVSGEAAKAQLLLARLWRENPGSAPAGFVVSRLEPLSSYLSPISCRIAILRSFTVEPIVPLLRAAALINGLELTVQIGDFNAYAQEMIDRKSNLYRFGPDIVFLAVQTRDLTPDLWNGYADLRADDLSAVIDRVSTDFRSWVQAFRSYCQAPLILHTLETPFMPSNGILDSQSETGQVQTIRRINLELLRLAHEQTNVYLLNYDALIARHGKITWKDEHKWLTARLPISADCLIHLADEWLRFIHPLTGKVCKALVIDLDNTLWGGVIGEDGMNGIALGPEYPGAAYQDLQRAILDLHRRGVILTVCSKNNPTEAMEALERHPEMLLRPSHFSVLRINWNDKVRNIREIAEELKIGIDALAFLDDNPVERQWIRSQLPEVTVIDLPGNPMEYAEALRESPVFERLDLSDEDLKRGKYYAEERRRKQMKENLPSLNNFYRSLSMEVDIFPVNQGTLSRVAQLTQKTNQFNLTTRRYTEQQISEIRANPDWRVYAMRVRDRFGDSGLVGVAIIHLQDDTAEIDTFLLSCRVIGRTLETALLAMVAEQARRAGARRLWGWFFPTKKNAPARDFFQVHGFSCILDEVGKSCWEFNLDEGAIRVPAWIKFNRPEEGEY